MEELEHAGFEGADVNRASRSGSMVCEKLRVLNQSCATAPRDPTYSAPSSSCAIDTDCRGYLMHLGQIGILSAGQRELVIDRLMALDADDIDIEKVKWVVLMVLFSQPGQEQAYARMEDLVFEERTDAIH